MTASSAWFPQAHRQLTLELRQIETQERSNQDRVQLRLGNWEFWIHIRAIGLGHCVSGFDFFCRLACISMQRIVSFSGFLLHRPAFWAQSLVHFMLSWKFSGMWSAGSAFLRMWAATEGMRAFDAFARPVQEFQVKTAIGGYISIGSLCLVLALFFAELRYFLTPEAKDEMLIDQNQDRKYLNISFDISFSSLPCAALSLNLLDPKGANVMHVAHEIYKQRRSKTGEMLGKPIRDSLPGCGINTFTFAGSFLTRESQWHQ